MASPSLSTIRQVSRDYAQDNSATSSNWSVSQALQDEVINRFYIRYKLLSEPWVQDLPAATTGLTVPAGFNTIQTTMTTIRHIKDMYLATSAGTTVRNSIALERLKPFELDLWAAYQVPPSNAPIARYSAIRLGDMTKAAGNVGAWQVHVDPIPTADSYLIARCTLEASTLINPGDVPDLSDEEGYGIAALTGAWMAIRCNRPQLVQSILAEIPASMAAIAKGLQTDEVISGA